MGSSCSCDCHPRGDPVSNFREPGVVLDAASLRQVGQVVDKVVTFVPRRVADAFVRGLYNNPDTGQVEMPPQPRELEAAVLLVDVSGFTRLSESYSKMGTEGCEEFSLLMSSFLARMCAIIAKFGGDIDCFAGDALIVVFPADPTDALSNSTRNYRTGLSGHNSLAKSRTRSVLSSAGLPARRGSSIPSIAPQRHDVISTGIGEVASKGHSLQKLRSSSSGASLGPLTVHAGGSKMSRQGSVIRPQMDEAIDYAISCAMSISRELNGFQASKDDPPLGIHSALAAGLIYAVECGGKATPRCEAFIAGKPLQDLGVALPQAGQSELVLAPSAVAYTTEEVLLEAGDKENGCKVLSLPQGQPGFRIPFGKTFRRIQSKRSTAAAKVLEAMLAMEERTRATKPLASARCTRNTAISRTPRPTFAARMSNLLSTLGSMSLGQSRVRERSCFSYSTRQYSIFESTAARKAEADTVALKSLMTFLPQFVRQRCLDGMALSDLSENRTVSVLFVVADLQGSSLTLEKIKVLQELLGKAVDVADGKCGGTTRQITVDEKGLAAIFIFGLPGFSRSNPALRCLAAGIEVIEVMNSGDIPCTAGLDTGPCFCGLVGDPTRRCEYAVLGDTVNTAARIAWKAHKMNAGVLCTEAFHSSLRDVHVQSWIKMEPAGTVMLKGKQTETALYAVKQTERPANPFEKSHTTELVGRSGELQQLTHFITNSFNDANSAPRMMVIEGIVGMGKTALLGCVNDMLRKDSSGLPNNLRVLNLKCTSNDRPFQTCQQILQTVFNLSGVRNAAQFSYLEADEMWRSDPRDLPSILQPFSKERANGWDRDPNHRMSELQKLYSSVLNAGLHQQPTVLLLDDSDAMDSSSLEVLALIGTANPGSLTGSFKTFSRLTPVTIILTACKPLLHPSGRHHHPETGFRADLTTSPKVVHVMLGPLEEKAIEILAMQVMQCQALRQDLVDHLMEEARGIPLHAKELCKWLADNSMLEVDQHGNTGLRKAVKADAFTPPSLHNIVRAHIDQLSPRLGTVLRFASILGYTFDTQVLHGLVKDELGLSMSVLHGQLCTLEDAGFVRQRSDVGGQLLDEKDYRTSWQFSQSIYQQVVYSAILHKHRRQLHRNAAEMLMKQLGELEGSTTLHAKQRQRELHSQMAEHWLKVIDGIHKPVGAKRLSDADFSGLFKVISWQVTDSLENCNVQDTLRFQSHLQDCTQACAYKSSAAWCTVHMDIVEFSIATLLKLSGMSNDGTTHREVSTRLEQLALQVVTLASHRDGRPEDDDEGEDDAIPPCAVDERLAVIVASARVAPALAAYASTGRLHQPVLDSVHVWAVNAQLVHSKLIYGATFLLTAWSASCFRDAAAVAEDVYNAFEQAGRPVVSCPCPKNPMALLISGYWFTRLLSGELGSEAATARFDRDASLMDVEQQAQCLSLICSLEGVCDPQSSPRVLAWRSRLEYLQLEQSAISEEAHKPAWVDVCMQKMHAKSPLVRRHVHSKYSSHIEIPVAAGDAQNEWSKLTCAAIDKYIQLCMPMDLIATARNSVSEGCRVMFSSLGKQMYITDLGALHLTSAAAALSKCLQHWERNLVRDDDRCSCSAFPAALIWGRAMLHWFQWRLWQGGFMSKGAIEDPRLQQGVRGWERGPVAQHGLSTVCSMLLLAQSVSVSDRRHLEILPAFLPATVSLARLLRGEGSHLHGPHFTGQPDVPCEALSVTVPKDPPVQGDLRESIRTLSVVIGSAEAMRVACSHLKAAISSVKVGGAHVVLSDVPRTPDLGASETLAAAWELYWAIKHQLNAEDPARSTSSIALPGSTIARQVSRLADEPSNSLELVLQGVPGIPEIPYLCS